MQKDSLVSCLRFLHTQNGRHLCSDDRRRTLAQMCCAGLENVQCSESAQSRRTLCGNCNLIFKRSILVSKGVHFKMRDRSGTGLSIAGVRKVTYTYFRWGSKLHCKYCRTHALKRVSGFSTMQICNLLTSKSKAIWSWTFLSELSETD